MKHLDDHQIAAFLSGEPIDPDAGEHLDSCLVCRQQLTELESLIAGRRETQAAEEPDWERQHEQIMTGLPAARRVAAPRRRWTRPLLAAAAVILAVIGLGRIGFSPTPVDVRIEPDFQIEEFLAEVDAVLSDDSLPGFESIDPGFDDPESMISNGAS